MATKEELETLNQSFSIRANKVCVNFELVNGQVVNAWLFSTYKGKEISHRELVGTCYDHTLKIESAYWSKFQSLKDRFERAMERIDAEERQQTERFPPFEKTPAILHVFDGVAERAEGGQNFPWLEVVSGDNRVSVGASEFSEMFEEGKRYRISLVVLEAEE